MLLEAVLALAKLIAFNVFALVFEFVVAVGFTVRPLTVVAVEVVFAFVNVRLCNEEASDVNEESVRASAVPDTWVDVMVWVGCVLVKTVPPDVDGKLKEVLSVPLKVRVLFTVNVLPAPRVRVPVPVVMVLPFTVAKTAAPAPLTDHCASLS